MLRRYGSCYKIFTMKQPILLLVILICKVSCHRLCLDFKPPVQIDETFDLCQDFEKFGCCSKEQDSKINARYLSLVNQLSDNENKEECSNVLKNLLCQECSEYSAHQYNLEESNEISTLPGICWENCKEIFTKCKEALVLLSANDTAILKLLQKDNHTKFCDAIELPDRYYCYPLEDELTAGYLEFYELPNEKPCIQLCIEEVANKLYSPVSMRHAGDGTHRFFVAEQRGIVWIFLRNMSKIHPPFLNKTSDVNCILKGYDERGFLDIQFHPNHISNGRFYIYYTTTVNSEDIIRISEMKVSSADINRADHDSERVLLELAQPYTNHNGGQLLFGNDGYLYIFTGDGGSGGDPHGHAQNKSSLLGKVLRIDVDTPVSGDKAYAIPPDNPFVSEANVASEIYAYGLRNPWRCTIDPKGRIICADVGQNSYEEIDIIVKGGNYGWRAFEAETCYDEDLCKDSKMKDEHIPPIFSYNTTYGKSITGGHVYRGCQNPNLRNRYIFGDFMSGRMFALKETKNGEWKSKNVCISKKLCRKQNKKYRYPRYILAFGEDESGEMYFGTTLNPMPGHKGGRIYKLSQAKVGTKKSDECQQPDASSVDISEESWLENFKIIPDTEVQIRLVGSGQGRIPTKGRVEIRIPGRKWSTICGDSWNLKNAHVICRMIGFLKAREATIGEYGIGKGLTRFEKMNCNGHEDHIDECEHSGWDFASCTHENDASVWCESFPFAGYA